MNSSHFTLAAALGAFCVSLAACGSSSPSGAGGGATTTTTSSSSTSSSSGAGGSSSSSTSSSSGAGGGVAVTLDCASYCGEVMANCTAGNAQYASDADCKASCASFPPGALADMGGDTLGCRIYHGGIAQADPTTHCQHAGVNGGDIDPTDAIAGKCGEGCEAFCDLALLACTGANVVYADAPTCLAECKTFNKSTTGFSTADQTTNDFNCRVYHLTAASTDPGLHCQHIKAVSAVCKP